MSIPLPTTGHPIVDGVATVTTGLGIGLSALGAGIWALWAKASPLLQRIEGFAKTGAEQTVSSHESSLNHNLRDDLDTKHADILAAFGDVKAVQADLKNDIIGLRSEVRADRQAQRETAYDLAQHIRDHTGHESRLMALETKFTRGF